jgi:glycerol dehydrogenase
MKMVFISPRKYVQGRGVMAEIGSYLKLLGGKPILLWDEVVKGLMGQTVLASVSQAGLTPIDVPFGGEATREEAARIAAWRASKAPTPSWDSAAASRSMSPKPSRSMRGCV